MKIFKAIMLGIAMLFIVSLSGCSKEESYEGMTKVVFELEGGVYQNCTLPVINYYDVEEGSSTLIYELGKFSMKEVQRSGYVFQGWYKTKETVNDNVTYSDKWDFETDLISTDGITLYAYWKKAIQHTYNVCYKDENNQTVVLGTYEVEYSADDKDWMKFNDYIQYANNRYGYTAISYVDENGNPWNEDFEHPLGDENLAINVYVKYIEGEYKLIKTAEDLIKYKNQNIYLLNDIDMGGKTFSFGDYKKDFQGNNFTISNFSVNYNEKESGLIQDFDEPTKKSLCVSIFGSLDGANIENVKFENVSVVISTGYTKTFKIYVSPLSTKITESTIKNVSINGSYDYTNLPNNFDINESLIYVTDKLAYIIDDKSIIENSNIEITTNLDKGE